MPRELGFFYCIIQTLTRIMIDGNFDFFLIIKIMKKFAHLKKIEIPIYHNAR